MTHHNSSRTGLEGSDIADDTGRQSILNLIREDMDVYDVNGNHIGEVEFVHFGAASETQQELGVGPATPSPADDPDMRRRDSIIDNIAEAFHPDEVPRQLQEKLLLTGYVLLDADGLFARDRFILPEQIASVSDDRVQLSVTRDQLIKRE